MTPAKIPEGFTRWEGGENPAPGKLVDCMYATATRPVGRPINSERLRWSHNNSWADIIAYRVVSP